MSPRRYAPSYIGVNHETVGSDILAVLRVVVAPEDVLGPELARTLGEVKPTEWYPIGLLLDLLDRVDARRGSRSLHSIGSTLFRLSHEANVKRVASSARDIVYGIDGMYRVANRGIGIGGWRVISFDPGRATLEKTTPHHCVMEEGILHEALLAMGVSARIEQTECLRRGGRLCRYSITSAETGRRWTGGDSHASP